jgi:hypothetical protein
MKQKVWVRLWPRTLVRSRSAIAAAALVAGVALGGTSAVHVYAMCANDPALPSGS